MPRSTAHRAPQQGMVLIMLLLIVGLAATAYLVNTLDANTVKIERDKKTAVALAEAKAALIGYAVMKATSVPPGYLLNPDMGPGNNTEGVAAGGFSGNDIDISLIGKLPWYTIGTSPLKDGVGECLWYIVSGRFKNSPITAVLNWDTPGQIDVIDASGNTMATNLAALIVSSGQPIDTQNRTLGDVSLIQCGGNFDARNYLDSYDMANAINGEVNYFSGSVNNRLAPDKSNKRFVLAKNDHYNDRFVFVTVDDIFRPIIRRSDFSAQISALLDDSTFKVHLQNVEIEGGKGTDKVNCAVISNPTKQSFCINWKEMLLLAQLPVMSSITIDSGATPSCKRVLIFGGKKTGAQVRLTPANKADPANYLEGSNLTAFATNASSYSGVSTFKASNPSADILRCL